MIARYGTFQSDHKLYTCENLLVMEDDESMNFIITVCCHNAETYVGECLNSVRRQTVAAWRCIVVDDASTDRTADRAKEAAGDDPRILVARNPVRQYLLANTAAAIDRADPDPEDVVVSLDGDDRLHDDKVLERVLKAYQTQEAWMTYGCYCDFQGNRAPENGAYPSLVKALNAYRWSRWRASHLKTFKVWLWRCIPAHQLTITPDQHRRFLSHLLWTGRFTAWRRLRHVSHDRLVDPSGRYFRRCVDKVTMFPMLEMAGHHAVFIPDLLYDYRPSSGGRPKPTSANRYLNRFIRLYLKRQKRCRPLAYRAIR